MKENFKDIPGYEGIYQVSNLGSVKSLIRKTRSKNGSFLTKEKILKAIFSKHGYLKINLYKDKKLKNYQIHRLVMLTFKGTSDLQVNHINGIKVDNDLENLEYCTAKENMSHAFRTGLANNSHFNKKIYQYDFQGNFIKEHKNTLEAKMQTGIDQSLISKCANGKRKTSGGYIWTKSKNINIEKIINRLKTNNHISTKIYQYDKQEIFLKEFASTYEAGRQTGIIQQGISACVNNKRKSAGGYIWKRLKKETVQ